jgi:hypothetical protein
MVSPFLPLSGPFFVADTRIAIVVEGLHRDVG